MLPTSTAALRPNTTLDPCHGVNVTAPAAKDFSQKTWRLPAWERGAPKRSTIAAHWHHVRCAVGAGHRKVIRKTWRDARAEFLQHRKDKLAALRWEPYVCGDRRYALPCAITECESGFYFGHHSGAYGILDSTWVYWGGSAFAPYPGAATPREQAIVARRVWEAVGPSGWECPL